MTKQKLTLFLATVIALLVHLPATGRAERAPNFVIILADDLGYGDLSRTDSEEGAFHTSWRVGLELGLIGSRLQ